MIKADFIIVGAGLTGSTIARLLADHNQDVIILDRKNHLAGNELETVLQQSEFVVSRLPSSK